MTEIDSIEITHPDKIVLVGVTKLDIAKYYHDISPLMLRYLKNRIVSVLRCHGEEIFFKKHPSAADKVERVNVDDDEYFYLKNAGEIVHQAQLGTVEFHTWGSAVKTLENPDLMVFDLDPAPDVDLSRLREAAEEIKAILDELALPAYLKTSGGKGYHILVRIHKRVTWPEFSVIAQNIAELASSRRPDLFTLNMRKSSRTGKIFLDHLRNKRGSTCVSAFSLRARPNAPISLPISWDDLYNITPNEVNISNYKKYINLDTLEFLP